ncbi:MAG: GNAT family N-acetyltransferase [Thermomicrobiales bacterium]
MIRRAIAAESEAFVDLYQAASDSWNTAHDEFDGIRMVWNPQDPDPAFSVILNLSEADDYDAAIRSFEERGRERAMPRIGINSDPAIEQWRQRGDGAATSFGVDSEEFFWAQPVREKIEIPDLSAGATVELATGDIRHEWGETLNLGHNYPAGHARGHVYATAIERPNWRHYLIRVEGEPAAASVLYIARKTGQCFVTATRPEFRRRGFQSYFVARRLHDTLAAGCTMAATQTVIGNASARNMERAGFTLLYKRQILSKPL